MPESANEKSNRHRLQVRLNTLSPQQLLSGKGLHDAVNSLGLTTYTIEDMNDLVNAIASYIDLRFVKREEANPHLPRAISSGSIFSAQDTGDGFGKAVYRWPKPEQKAETHKTFEMYDDHYNHNLVPARALMDVFLSKDPELPKRIFSARLLKQFQAMREILLAGDTNKLVAELTFVRINDLAAPPESVDPLAYLEPIVAVLILVNGIMIGFQTDPNFEDWRGWPYVELVFAILLVAECLVRLWLSGGLHTFFCTAEWIWNIFDVFLMCTAITDVVFQLAVQDGADIFGASLLRFCRLIRLVRVVKVFRLNYMKELRLMVKGLVGGIRTLLLAFALLFAVLYVIAGFATMTVGRDDRTVALGLQNHFENIPQSMFTSFRCFSGECFADTGAPIASILASVFGWPFVLGYVLSYMLVSMGIFNVILAVYVDITMRAAKETEATTAEQYARESIRIARTTRELLKKFAEAYRLFHDTCEGDVSEKTGRITLNDTSSFTDADIRNDIAITKELFLLVIQDQTVQKLMNDLELPADRANLFEVIDADGSGTLHVSELVQGLLKIRGELTKSDTIAVLLTSQAVYGMLVGLKNEQARFQESIQRSVSLLRSAAMFPWASAPAGGAKQSPPSPPSPPKPLAEPVVKRQSQDGLLNVHAQKPDLSSSPGFLPDFSMAEMLDEAEWSSLPISAGSTGRVKDI